MLDEEEWVAAAELKDDLEHVRKWPAEHWKLAFQGQLRTVSRGRRPAARRPAAAPAGATA